MPCHRRLRRDSRLDRPTWPVAEPVAKSIRIGQPLLSMLLRLGHGLLGLSQRILRALCRMEPSLRQRACLQPRRGAHLLQQPPQRFGRNILRGLHLAHEPVGVAVQPLIVSVIDFAEGLGIKCPRPLD